MYYKGFKISEWFGDKYKIEVRSSLGFDWIFLFSHNEKEKIINIIDDMEIIYCEGYQIYNSLKLVEWDGGALVYLLKDGIWKFIFNSSTIEKAKDSIDIIYPKGRTIKYKGFDIIKYGYNECVLIERGEIQLYTESFYQAKNVIDIIEKFKP